ncbi:glycoside hydrolase family 6 protein [Streptomyces sp. 549]|uniref:glycoside hydrolase family 6 protein n=1 Tax=Streptomyces sp. 549 TaxID=3049076 RepID=UPI0024C23EA3|nr:glycoside hydrolase family 6 protein [Streptomyces sp. 549]MDK1473756.1 glycoside hydrolase family 6 protein [Streptomyces sp. 549]
MYGTDAGRTHRTHRTVRPGVLAGGAAAAAMVVLAGCSSSEPEGGTGGNGPSDRPERAGAPFWVNPENKSAKALDEVRGNGKKQEAALIEKIAEQPVGEWIGTDDPEGDARRATEAAAKQGVPALMVLYNIPHRDCGQYSQGGAKDGAAYRDWLGKVVKGIGDREAWLVIEPDALPHILEPGCVPEAKHAEQYTLMNEAVTELKKLPATKVYLDAGNPHWIRDAGRMVEPLKRAGIDKADGFSLNVSNYQTTEENVEYGNRLSSMVGGKNYLVDTSRNGNGPMEGDEDAEAWCNPPGRALGQAPTTDTGEERADAFAWIKRPGESDGTCKSGPEAGEWFHDYALELARNAEAG